MTDEILIKYLLGESEIEEVTFVEQWLKDSAPNQKYLLTLRGAWDKSQLLLKGLDPDLNKNLDQEASATNEAGCHYNTEEQWQLLKSKIDSQELALQHLEKEQAVEQISESVGVSEVSKSKATSLKNLNSQHPRKVRGLKRWAWIAALCILALGTWTAYNGLFSDKEGAGNDLILTATASPVTDTLSDGSIITLNHYSRLQAPLNFKGKTREVTLKEGEAFFKVAHMDKKPFLVHIGDVAVKVLGTSFNINSGSQMVVISVATGKVQVDYKKQHLILLADEQVSISANTGKLIRQKNTSLLYNYYVTRQFVARNTRLEELVTVLSEAYNTRIVFGNDRLKDLRLTTVFVKQPLDNILNIIAETFNIKVVKSGDVITLESN